MTENTMYRTMKPNNWLAYPWVLLWLTFCVVCCAPAAEPPKPLEVSVAHPSHGEIYRFVTLPGSIKPNQQVTLCAKVGGYLKTLSVDKGDRVISGQALGEIEVPELAAEAVKYRAEIKVAEVESARLSAAQKSAPELVTAQAVDEARGRLEIAQANLKRTETLLHYGQLTAPFSGVVTMRYVDPGAFIPAATSGSAAATAAILTLMDFQTVRIQVALPETEAALAQVDQPVKFSLEALPGKTFQTRLARLSYALDDATRTMLAEADLPNPDSLLRPGMFASVKVGIERHGDALLIPATALVVEKAGTSVFVASGGVAKKLTVKAGFNDGNYAEVIAGLTGDETVILAGKLPLADGVAINISAQK